MLRLGQRLLEEPVLDRRQAERLAIVVGRDRNGRRRGDQLRAQARQGRVIEQQLRRQRKAGLARTRNYL